MKVKGPDNGHVDTAAHTETRTAAVYNAKWRTDQQYQ